MKRNCSTWRLLFPLGFDDFQLIPLTDHCTFHYLLPFLAMEPPFPFKPSTHNPASRLGYPFPVRPFGRPRTHRTIPKHDFHYQPRRRSDPGSSRLLRIFVAHLACQAQISCVLWHDARPAHDSPSVTTSKQALETCNTTNRMRNPHYLKVKFSQRKTKV